MMAYVSNFRLYNWKDTVCFPNFSAVRTRSHMTYTQKWLVPHFVSYSVYVKIHADDEEAEFIQEINLING